MLSEILKLQPGDFLTNLKIADSKVCVAVEEDGSLSLKDKTFVVCHFLNDEPENTSKNFHSRNGNTVWFLTKTQTDPFSNKTVLKINKENYFVYLGKTIKYNDKFFVYCFLTAGFSGWFMFK